MGGVAASLGEFPWVVHGVAGRSERYLAVWLSQSVERSAPVEIVDRERGGRMGAEGPRADRVIEITS